MNKAVAIVNFHWENRNFGAVLTAYALNRTITKMGYEARNVASLPAVDWVREQAPNPKFDAFRKSHLPVTDPVNTAEDFDRLNARFGTFVVGSDQVWRHEFVGRELETYFLLFAHADRKTVAYAASFGGDPFAGYGRGFLKRLLATFDFVSLRETSARDRLRSIDAEARFRAVLDPVFLLSPDEWMALADTGDVVQGEVVTYSAMMAAERKFGAFCRHNAARLGGTCARVLDDESIEGWLGHLSKAAFVVTDSFHGVCFAIIFGRQFVCVAPPSALSSRQRDLLASFGLADRVVSSVDEIDPERLLARPIDYAAVRERLAVRAGCDADWLRVALVSPLKTGGHKPAARRALLAFWRRRIRCRRFRLWCRLVRLLVLGSLRRGRKAEKNRRRIAEIRSACAFLAGLLSHIGMLEK